MTESNKNTFRLVKARDLKSGDVIKAVEVDGELVTIESTYFIAGTDAITDHIGYSCVHGSSAIPAEDQVSLLIQ
jgi:hypothetical protein